MKFLPALGAVVAMLFAAAPAIAVDTVTAKDPQTVVDALAEMGYRGTLDKLDSGRPSIGVKISGLNTFIDFYDCADDFTGCSTLLFFVSIDLKDGATLTKANQWNFTEITGRALIDDNGDPQMDYAVSTFEGVPFSIFEQTVQAWDRQLGDFKDYFDF